MTEEVQTAEAVETNEPVEAVETESSEVETQEQESPTDDTPQVEETIEEKAARLEKEHEKAIRKIKRQTAAYSSTQKAYNELKQKLEENQSQQPNREQPKEPTINDTNPDGSPVYETLDDFNEALINFRAEQKVKSALREREEQSLKQKQAEAQAQRQKLVQEQEAKFSEVNPDYQESREDFVEHTSNMRIDPQVENAMIEVAIEAGAMADVIHYFGADGGARLGEFDEIASLPAWKAAIRINDIIKGNKRSETPQTKTRPMPKPIKSVSGTGKPQKSLDSMSGDEVLKTLGLK
ncbi:MAG: hypothetical protein CBC71_06350 [Rhodobacteraceae bacterium TMED111]|nr:hypothetical protein [Marinovum sp.]MAI17156.1 hypothetical protein [Marinovum sp.]OUV41065.1 MAG: hypothetical protein CBC71_06070 [Rhodobacteraceae bacterium TMED111]OUV41119.1 MAG: hypothetical protein CBC71_06350 [Rhodobacteraceae bacterium TMED111]|tara:strand:+ start:1772 stop:2653 length:882 start_codon:yes stop_codon:yes gene_type:complete